MLDKVCFLTRASVENMKGLHVGVAAGNATVKRLCHIAVKYQGGGDVQAGGQE